MSDPIHITSLDDRWTTVAAFVNGFDAGGNLTFAVTEGLTDESRVMIDAGHKYLVLGMVLSTADENDKYYATIRIDGDERRRNQRITANTKAYRH